MEKSEIKTRKIIRLYWALSAAETLAKSLVVATCVIFFIERGLNLFEVNIVILATVVITFAFEVPTGAIADLFGRKVSCVCAYFMVALGLFIYAISNSLPAFIIAATIEAIALTLLSGAFEAWLVDNLEHHAYKGNLTPVFAKEDQITLIAGIVGVLIGSFLADNDSALPWLIGSFAMFLIGIAAAILMKEEYFVKQNVSLKTGIGSMKETMRTSAKYAKDNKAVRFILLTGILLAFAIQVPAAQYQPLFSQFVPNKMWLGYLWATMSIAAFGGARLSPWFSSKLENRKSALILLQIMIGLGILLSGAFAIFPMALAAFVAFLFWMLASGILSPIRKEYLNKNISSRERATIISLLSMTATIGSAIGLLLGGLLAKYISISIAWVFSGAALIILTLLVMRNSKRNNEWSDS